MSNDIINFNNSVLIGGIQQWIYIKGNDRKNPVILFLHGGPGLCESQFGHLYGKYLEQNFTICHWDQRGCNRSYSPNIALDSMTFDRFIQDLFEVIQCLKKDLGCEKIVLVGHSWGSFLGLYFTSLYPRLVRHYVGIGQTVNIDISRSYRVKFVHDSAIKSNDLHILEELKEMIKNPDNTFNQALLLNLVTLYGGNYFDPQMSEKLDALIAAAPTDYQPVLSYRDMPRFSKSVLSRLLFTDLMTNIRGIDVPCLFVHGVMDNMAPLSLVKNLLGSSILQDKKEIILVQNAAHWPHHEQPEKFAEILLQVVKS